MTDTQITVDLFCMLKYYLSNISQNHGSIYILFYLYDG